MIILGNFLLLFLILLFCLSVITSSGCNSCALQKDQKQLQHQYYLLADSSLLSPSLDPGHPEIIAISELKGNKIDGSTSTKSSSKRCIQTFDPYTTFIQTLYGTHTEISTTTQCIATIQPPSSQFLTSMLPPSQQPIMLPCQLPIGTRTTELISNNQLLGLIHNQICVQNDRLRQMFNELVYKNIPTSYITKTLASTMTSTLCTPSPVICISTSYINTGVMPISSSQCIQAINNGGNIMNNLQYQLPQQMRVVIATSTYLLPQLGTYLAPGQEYTCKPTNLFDSF